MTQQRIKRPQVLRKTKYTDKGGYGFDNGCVAFGDPLEQMALNKAKKERERQKYKKKPANTTRKSDFILKHNSI